MKELKDTIVIVLLVLVVGPFVAMAVGRWFEWVAMNVFHY